MFQAEHLKQALENLDKKKKIMNEDTKRRYCVSIKNFLKVIQSLGVYDEKLPEVKAFLYSIKSENLLKSLQGLLCSFTMKCKGEFAHNTKEQALRALLDVIATPTVRIDDG